MPILESLVEISLVFPVHASEDVLEDYAFGRLSGDHLDAVDDHLLVCDACRGELARTEDYIRLVRIATLRPRRQGRLAVVIDLWNTVRNSLRASVTAQTGAWAGGAAVLALACVLGSVSLTNRFSPMAASAPLQSYRGGRSGNSSAINQAPAARPLDFTIRAEDVPAAPEYRIEVVTESGRQVWAGAAQMSGAEVRARLEQGLAAGLYWVRLYDQRSQLLSEFGLRVK